MKKHLLVMLALCALFPPLALMLPETRAQGCLSPNWEGRYYNSLDLSGAPAATTCDPAINFNWGFNAPAPAVNADNFSARWTSSQIFPTAGSYQFSLTVEDGARLFVNGTPLINAWSDNPTPRTLTALFDVAADGATVFITLEVVSFSGSGQAQLFWSLVGGGLPTPTPAPLESVAGTVEGQPWEVAYFNNTSRQAPIVFEESVLANGISRNYGVGAPGLGVNPDGWSARWTREVQFQDNTYTFTARADDGLRVTLDGVEIFNVTELTRAITYTATVRIPAGLHTLVVEHFDTEGEANLFLTWDPPVGTTLRPDGCNGEAAGVNGNAPPCPEFMLAAPQIPVTVRAGPLNFRETASQSAPRIQFIRRGEEYMALGRTADNIWLLLEVEGELGWAMTEFLTPEGDISVLPVRDGSVIPVRTATPGFAGMPGTGATPTPTPEGDKPSPEASTVAESTLPPAGVQARALSFVRIRAGAGIDFEQVGSVDYGALVVVIGRNADGSWFLVDYNGLQGWSAAEWYEPISGNFDAVPVVQ